MNRRSLTALLFLFIFGFSADEAAGQSNETLPTISGRPKTEGTPAGREESAVADTGNVQEELVALKERWNEAFRRGDKTFFEAHLAENFTYADTGNRKFMDRAKFIAKARKYNDIKTIFGSSLKWLTRN
jgi:hypothetical protein